MREIETQSSVIQHAQLVTIKSDWMLVWMMPILELITAILYLSHAERSQDCCLIKSCQLLGQPSPKGNKEAKLIAKADPVGTSVDKFQKCCLQSSALSLQRLQESKIPMWGPGDTNLSDPLWPSLRQNLQALYPGRWFPSLERQDSRLFLHLGCGLVAPEMN